MKEKLKKVLNSEGKNKRKKINKNHLAASV